MEVFLLDLQLQVVATVIVWEDLQVQIVRFPKLASVWIVVHIICLAKMEVHHKEQSVIVYANA
jgi:hypothetical protein